VICNNGRLTLHTQKYLVPICFRNAPEKLFDEEITRSMFFDIAQSILKDDMPGRNVFRRGVSQSHPPPLAGTSAAQFPEPAGSADQSPPPAPLSAQSRPTIKRILAVI